MGVSVQQPQDIFSRRHLKMQVDHKDPVALQDARDEHEKAALLGAVLGIVWAIMGSINDSYTIAGDAAREYMKSFFRFSQDAARAMKSSHLWEAWGSVAAGALGAYLGALSLSKMKGYANSTRQNQPRIEQKNQEIRNLNNRNNVVGDRVDGVNAPANDAVELGIENPNNALPEPRQLTEAQRARETQALQNEINDLREAPHNEFTNATQWLGFMQLVGQGIQGLTKVPSSGYEEAAALGRATAELTQSVLNPTRGFLSGLEQAFNAFAAAIRDSMETVKASAQMR